jgi:hypothetical protein
MTTIQVDVQSLRADGLRPEELAELRGCIKAVRDGTKEYYVELTNKKQTKGKKRMPGVDFEPHPALAPHAHRGWLVAAPVNQKGEVYIHLYDEARAKVLGENFGHTNATLRGLRSFEVMVDPRTGEAISRPGPLGAPEPKPEPKPEPAPQQQQGQAFQGFDPRLFQAAAMFFTAQAFTMLAQVFQAQAQQAQAQAQAQQSPPVRQPTPTAP